MHPSSSSASIAADDKNRGVAVEKLENMKKWGINTYKVAFLKRSEHKVTTGRLSALSHLCLCSAQNK